MAAAAAGETRRLIHFSSIELPDWEMSWKKTNTKGVYVSMMKVSARGKPAGLWYAYDDKWVEHYIPQMRRHSPESKAKARFAYKYVFTVDAGKFIRDVAATDGTDKILQLSVDNFAALFERFPFNPKAPSAWRDFWKSVGVHFGGVEFGEDLVSVPPPFTTIDTSTGLTIDVSWLKEVELISGCIFNPAAVFDGRPPSDFLDVTNNGRMNFITSVYAAPRPSATAGGSRRRRSLHTVPRRFTATRRSRSRVQRRAAHPKKRQTRRRLN